MKLVILGLLMERDMHPYEITQTLKERHLHLVTKLQIGSLYYAVDRLEKEQCIKPVEVVRGGSRPDKTIYRITEKGRKQFRQLLLRKFEEPEPVFHPLYAALIFADRGDQAKIADILESRIKWYEQFMKVSHEVYLEHISEVPRAVLHMMVGRYEHAKTELRWLKRLYADARQGKLGDVGSPIELEEEAGRL